MGGGATINANGKRVVPAYVPMRRGFWTGSGTQASTLSSSGSGVPRPVLSGPSALMSRPGAKSGSFVQAPAQIMVAAARYQQQLQ